MITITERNLGEDFAAWYQNQGISLVLTAFGQGTATTEVLNFLGLEASEKAILLCTAPYSPKLIRRAAKELWLDIPGQGVLMAVPISSIGGALTKNYLLQHQEEAEETMEKELTHELLVVITKQGHTEEVMDAARSAGATGGTTIHAKGSGIDLDKRFFGVSIASERELVLILTKNEDRNAIMKAIMTQAGPQTDAQSLIFSMPVTDIAGLRQLEDEENAE